MKKKWLYVLFFFSFLILFPENAFAESCDYEYLYLVYSDGSTDNTATAYKDETLNFKDKKVSDSALENWNNDKCPDYIVKTTRAHGFLYLKTETKYYGYDSSITWDGTETETMRNNGSETKKVFQKTTLEEENPKITCEYDGFDLLIDATTHSISGSSTQDSPLLYYHYSSTGTLNDEWFASDGSIGKCLPVTVCLDKVDTGTVLPDGMGTPISHFWYSIFIDDLQVSQGKYKPENCKKYSYKGDKEDYKVDENHYACTTYENKLNKINTLYQQSSSNPSDRGKIHGQINQEIKILQTLCKAAYNTFTYESDCVKACVNLEADIAKIKDKYGINGSGSSNANCGLSARLANWIMKLINWMRYIVPVLLILLSVLDFIKAIAADSDDEVKKVTSKFVKRLIVAVVIFLVPLALQFLLGIFGIDANNFCL